MKFSTFLKFAAFSAFVTFTYEANAQLDSCNVFLKGAYVEVGISPSGSYGSSSIAPAGYHANALSGSFYKPCNANNGNHCLGFVADPAMDGWTVGTPPYNGDYFLPGSPFEGWSIQEGTNPRQDAWNTLTTGFTGTLTGTNTSYTTSGSKVIGTWQGTYDSIDITQITTLDTNNLYFITQVILTNTAVAPKNDIYYLRSLDPDNDQLWPGGGFTTSNRVEYQVTDTTVVSATGLGSGAAYMALGTSDTNAECFVYSSWSPAVTIPIADMYYHTAWTVGSNVFYAPGVTHGGDIALGLTFRVAHLATVDSVGDSVASRTTGIALHPANQARFAYFYAFSGAAVDSGLKAIKNLHIATTVTDTTHPISHVNVSSVNAASITIYPNPSKDEINIAGLSLGDQITLYDMMGHRIDKNWRINNRDVNTFNLNGISAGAYVLIVRDANGSMKSRLPLQKQ